MIQAVIIIQYVQISWLNLHNGQVMFPFKIHLFEDERRGERRSCTSDFLNSLFYSTDPFNTDVYSLDVIQLILMCRTL